MAINKVEAAHHKFQRCVVGITWKDKVQNEWNGTQSKLGKPIVIMYFNIHISHCEPICWVFAAFLLLLSVTH